jgi:hypothetical protein
MTDLSEPQRLRPKPKHLADFEARFENVDRRVLGRVHFFRCQEMEKAGLLVSTVSEWFHQNAEGWISEPGKHHAKVQTYPLISSNGGLYSFRKANDHRTTVVITQGTLKILEGYGEQWKEIHVDQPTVLFLD